MKIAAILSIVTLALVAFIFALTGDNAGVGIQVIAGLISIGVCIFFIMLLIRLFVAAGKIANGPYPPPSTCSPPPRRTRTPR